MSFKEDIDFAMNKISFHLKIKSSFYHDIIMEIINKINLNEENIVYFFEKFFNFHNSMDIHYFIMSHKDFNMNFVYKYPNLSWNYYIFRRDIDISFILSNLDKDWNFYSLIRNNYFTFSQIMEIFKSINVNNEIEYSICEFSDMIHYEDFDFSILSFNYSDYAIKYMRMDEFIEHRKFEMYYVRTYPQFNWNWDLLTIHGKMTMEEAIKFLLYSDDKEKIVNKRFKNKIMKYFDNLMLQPWMNSWFIKRYISDPDDRRFYLRKIQEGKEGKIRSKNEELRWELVAKAMSPERIFDWYLDIHELDNEFQDVLPEGHPRKRCIS